MAQYDVTLRDYWRIIRKRKLYIIFATLMLGLTSFVTAQFSRPDPKYRAEAKVQYERSQNAQEAYVSALVGSDDLETQQAVIKSYDVVARIAQRLGMVDTTTASEETRIRAILGLRPLIVTSIEGLTNIITISITHGNRFQAQEIANFTAEEYQQYNYEVRNAKLLRNQQIIKSRRDTVIARLKRAQDELKHFQEETQIVSISSATSAALSNLGRARDRLDGLLVLQNSLNKILAAGDQASETDLLSFPPEEGGNRFNELLRGLQQLNQERNRLLINFTEQHPDIVSIDNRKRITINQMLEALAIQRDVLGKRIDLQTKEVEESEKRFKQLPELGIQLEELYRNVDIQSQLLQTIEEEYQKSQIAEADKVQEVTILQKALLPNAPINPSTPRTIAVVGSLLGLIIGVVAAFIAETLDTSIGTIEDVEEYLGVPVVGIIPQMDVESMREALESRKGGPVETEFVERRLRLATHFEPQSSLAESYRALRTNIQFANLEKGAKVISVTSSTNQEGKSTTTANLAVTLAQAGNRVLLVDGDLRRPTVARIFGLDREPGITDVILGNYSWREVVRTVTDIMVGGLGMDDIMMTAGMDNLNIITCGVLPPNPAEITDSRRMTEFLQEVKEAYDVVLVDSPPVLQATDATVLGTKVDGVLMVYKIGNVSRSSLRRAKLQLDNVGVTTLGVVINGLRADVSEDFRDMRYYSYYTYGTQSDEDQGPYLVRTYNRAKRQLEANWKKLQELSAPYIALAKEHLPLDRFFGNDEEEIFEAPPIEEENDLTSKLLRVSFWVFLVLFLTAGVLWQLGILQPQNSAPQAPVPTQEAPAPEKNTQESPDAPAPAVPEAAPEETPSKPDDASITPEALPHTALAQPTKVSTVPEPQAAINREKPEEPPVQKTVLAQSSPKALFALHVSSHKVEASARRDAARFRKMGYATQLVRTHISGRGIFHRLLIGQFVSRTAAKREIEKLRKRGVITYASILETPGAIPQDRLADVRDPEPTPSARHVQAR